MTTGSDTLYTGTLPSKHTSKEESKRTRKNRATPKASNQATEQPHYSLGTHKGIRTSVGVVGGAAVEGLAQDP